MLGKKTNWELVDRLLTKERNLAQSPSDQVLVAREGRYIEPPKGTVARLRSDKVKDQAALEFDRDWYRAQLEVSRHQLKRAVELKIKETDADIERLLTDISRKHLQYLTEMGLKNSEQREEALERLGEQTAQRVKRLRAKDWPETLIEQTIEGVIDVHQRFFDKILEE